jgi:hypothetical protein
MCFELIQIRIFSKMMLIRPDPDPQHWLEVSWGETQKESESYRRK